MVGRDAGAGTLARTPVSGGLCVLEVTDPSLIPPVPTVNPSPVSRPETLCVAGCVAMPASRASVTKGAMGFYRCGNPVRLPRHGRFPDKNEPS